MFACSSPPGVAERASPAGQRQCPVCHPIPEETRQEGGGGGRARGNAASHSFHVIGDHPACSETSLQPFCHGKPERLCVILWKIEEKLSIVSWNTRERI